MIYLWIDAYVHFGFIFVVFGRMTVIPICTIIFCILFLPLFYFNFTFILSLILPLFYFNFNFILLLFSSINYSSLLPHMKNLRVVTEEENIMQFIQVLL